MTDTKPEEKTPEIFTVDINWEERSAVIKSAKHIVDFHIRKTMDGYGHFYVNMVGTSSIPRILSGSYTTLEKAVEAVCHYIKNCKETFKVKSEYLAKERNAAKRRSEARNNPE